MKKVSTGTIYRLFKEQDKDTVIKKTNMKTYCVKDNIDFNVCQGKWLIDLNKFYKAVTNNKISSNVSMPRLRTKASALREWNSKHRKKIKKHIINVICDSGKIFTYQHGGYTVLNYDELEQELIRLLRERKRY